MLVWMRQRRTDVTPGVAPGRELGRAKPAAGAVMPLIPSFLQG